ncbi:LamG domain-containing protein [Cellulomonas humilata]|uniref:LamG domain-containing protein n=1 Tax=Cellulomonas humilata TaxID=144055 RepID=A0A7Y5ZZZ0_9CELL|nr:LamG domain-containing protein [Cellulomonas humilata]NUU17219.1 LamG domain-containing protein [Cellulomonas humilata]
MAVVLPAAGASAAKPSRGSAPVVSSAGISDPQSACAAGSARPWVRSTTPTLRATLTDPDGQAVRATFLVVDSRGRVVWAPPATGQQASGLEHAVTVPEGKLTDGGTYTWLVTGRDDGGRWGLPKLCQLTVDTAPPALPTITPVVGEPAVYAEDVASGGVSQRGSFMLSDESTDVVSYQYVFSGSASGEVPATAPTISYTPTTSGPQTLQVHAVDRAGNVSPTRLYRFTVAAVVTGGGKWLLDEGAGDVATGTGAPLTLTPTTTWTAGPLAELAGRPTDRALLFDGPADGAAAAGPAVDTTQPFTVSAFVRLDALGSSGAAVSQDGSAASGFTLGYDTTGCAEGVPACWTFATSGDDTSVTRSAGAANLGSWVHLTGTYDAAGGTIALYVCEIGTADAPGNLIPVTAGPVTVAAVPPSPGPFRLGQGFGGAAPFAGALSSVTVTEGVVASTTSVRRACSLGA